MAMANKINSFLADDKVRLLLQAEKEANPLKICFPRELDISRFLAWFLDPSEGHGLHDTPMRRLLTAAWRNCNDAQVTPRIKRLISPAATATRSFAGCLIQKEVRFPAGNKGKRGHIDLLILDPNPKGKLLIAIENKFGAGEGDSQLKKYGAALAKQFKDWNRVCIFLDVNLDVNNDTSSDSSWIRLNYEWLVDELDAADASLILGDESKSALQQFRAAIDINGDTTRSGDESGALLLQVVENHKDVVRQMADWRQKRRDLLAIVKAEFWSAITMDEKALRQLFHVYWQRYALWGEAVRMLSYASMLNAAKKAFPDVRQDPKRKAFFYWIPNWERFKREDAKVSPLQVVVRFLPTAEESDGLEKISNKIKGSSAGQVGE